MLWKVYIVLHTRVIDADLITPLVYRWNHLFGWCTGFFFSRWNSVSWFYAQCYFIMVPNTNGPPACSDLKGIQLKKRHFIGIFIHSCITVSKKRTSFQNKVKTRLMLSFQLHRTMAHLLPRHLQPLLLMEKTVNNFHFTIFIYIKMSLVMSSHDWSLFTITLLRKRSV